MMTIQLNRLIRPLPTILEYGGDDNIKAARLCDRHRTRNSAARIVTTMDPNKENVATKQQQRQRQQQVISKPRREDRNLSDKGSSIQSDAVTYTSMSYLHRLVTSVLFRASILLNHNTGVHTTHRTVACSCENRPITVSNKCANCDIVSVASQTSSTSSKMDKTSCQQQEHDGKKKFLHDCTSYIRSLCKRLFIISIMNSFLFVGLWCNLAQFVLYVTIYPVNRRLYQSINYYLVYTIMSPVISLAYYWANIKLNMRVAKSELRKQAKDPMLGIIVINHTFDLDWLACAVFGDQLDNLGAYKVVSKSELKYLPIIGWMSSMSQMLFVDRNWTKDKLILGRGLNKLLDYKQTMIGLFCEGTRLTPEKMEASVNYAKANNLRPLKYHLLPRPKGFAYCVQHLLKMKCIQSDNGNISSDFSISQSKYSDKEVPFRIFNAQVMIPARPTFGWFMRGEPFQADFYIEEVERSRFENLSEPEEFEQLLYDIYQRKDELVDIYTSNNNTFPGGFNFEYKRKVAPLITSTTGYILTYSVLIKFALAYSCSLIFWLSLAAIILSSLTLFSKYDKESRSKYSSPKLYDATKRPRTNGCKSSESDLFNYAGSHGTEPSLNGLTKVVDDSPDNNVPRKVLVTCDCLADCCAFPLVGESRQLIKLPTNCTLP